MNSTRETGHISFRSIHGSVCQTIESDRQNEIKMNHLYFKKGLNIYVLCQMNSYEISSYKYVKRNRYSIVPLTHTSRIHH